MNWNEPTNFINEFRVLRCGQHTSSSSEGKPGHRFPSARFQWRQNFIFSFLVLEICLFFVEPLYLNLLWRYGVKVIFRKIKWISFSSVVLLGRFLMAKSQKSTYYTRTDFRRARVGREWHNYDHEERFLKPMFLVTDRILQNRSSESLRLGLTPIWEVVPEDGVGWTLRMVVKNT